MVQGSIYHLLERTVDDTACPSNVFHRGNSIEVGETSPHPLKCLGHWNSAKGLSLPPTLVVLVIVVYH